MLGIVITTEDKMYKKDFAEPLFQSIGMVTGGFVIDDNGIKNHRPVNPVGTAWYDALPNKIHGDIVVMKNGWTEDGPGLEGLTEEECETIINLVYEMTDETVVLIKEPDHEVF